MRFRSSNHGCPNHPHPYVRITRTAVAGFAAPGGFDPEPDLPIDLDSYVDLLAATGVAVRSDRHDHRLGPPQIRVLEQVGIRSEHWVETVQEYPRRFFAMVGTVQRMAFYCDRC